MWIATRKTKQSCTVYKLQYLDVLIGFMAIDRDVLKLHDVSWTLKHTPDKETV